MRATTTKRLHVVLTLATTVLLLLCQGCHSAMMTSTKNNKQKKKSQQKPKQAQPQEEDEPDYGQMTVGEIWDWFACDEIFDEGPRPVHTAIEWMMIRDAYRAAVGLRRSSIIVSSGHGFQVDVEAKHASDEKGRGVFAVGDIPKGQLIWTTKYTARFDNGEEYRYFLDILREDLACDVIQWAYAQSLESIESKTTKAFISADLDEGSFINTVNGGDDNDMDEKPNIGCDAEAAKSQPGGCQQNYFALRDIQDGEELLLDYSDFAIPEGWEWFGL